MDTTRCTHRATHAGPRDRRRRGEGPPAVMHPAHARRVPVSRPALEGDPPCPCWRPALVIFTTLDYGDVVLCGA